ncbi:RNA pyrophosphohydrolase [Sphingobium estronivorans]|uniref:RNA pyrophosphohydrolase n=1 Tax=Sphingobium estronivorans TaxID=1577690 RepID=UPI001F07BA25|nr:RNA pyrophosphohydrolase [Sphingobium estronivorans]
MAEIAMKADGIAFHDAKLLLARASLAQYDIPSGDGRAPSRYRPSVGIALFNRHGGVWVGRRRDMNEPAWQLPQGAIDTDESPVEAAYRELHEELGIADAELLAEHDDWLRYDLPEELLGRTWGGNWRGQEQRWIAMRYLGEDAAIDIETAHPEFSEWYWADLRDIPGLAAPFKRPVYAKIAAHFAAFAIPHENSSAPGASLNP